jgi:hypothetical protein
MQSEVIKITDKNRDVIMDKYASRVLDDMDYNTLYALAHIMLKDSKKGLTNDQLINQISDYYPDLLEDIV